jgi:predicted nucleotidyltransferase
VLALAGARETVLTEIGQAAGGLPVAPASVIVFGSFARGEAGIDSDLDAVFVRPETVGPDDDQWAESVEQWRTAVTTLTGNRVEVLEISINDLAARLDSGQPVWRDIRHDGRVVHGRPLDHSWAAARA